ncbi:MAG: LCP family protein [Spirochaetaceae bacterium]|jgi:anionic cell wall polymer biosynthesis LytR-Cps2A-Psr (LCP) family protein|nr:LCP family protein [Spirochaetaceae bacterium]
MKKQIDFSIFLLAGIILIAAASVISVFFILNRDFAETNFSEGRASSTLFVIEHNEKPLGAYILLYNQGTKRAVGFEVPGEVGLILQQINRVDRIDTVYQSGKIEPYIKEIGKLLGIKVNYNIVFDMDKLAGAVDLLEGVNIFIPGDIKISDSGDHILFSSGFTKLDGDKTIEYLTYQNPDYDIETPQQRSQRFFTGFLKRLGEKKDFLKSADVNQLFQSYIKTNMDKRILAQFIDELAYVDIDRFTISPIGGNLREVSGKQLLFPYYEGSLIKDIVRQTLNSLAQRNGNTGGNRIFTVEVLNGAGIAGLAGRTAELIRGFGYDVINIGNADSADYEFTEIVDRSNFGGEAEKFAGIINCKRIVTAQSDNALQEDGTVMSPEDAAYSPYEYKADFTLIIGRDFNGRYTQN